MRTLGARRLAEASNSWIAYRWVIVPVKPSELMSMWWRLTFGDSTAATLGFSPRDFMEACVERVHGIGGVFFRAQAPKALAQSYSEHLGVSLTPPDYEHDVWQQEAGPTVFEPFPADTTYLGRPEQSWMVNFRVRNLTAMVAQLQSAGIAVEVDPQEYPNGFFARLRDPEGNPIQLWQPAGRDTLPPTTG